MKKFVISFAFIIVVLFAVDRSVGRVMWWVNQHTNDVSGPKIKYLVNDVDEDMVLMGASRCNCHYVPSIISDSIGMSVYNGGVDASNNIYAHFIVLSHIMSHHKPRYVCLEVMTSDFEKSDDSFMTTTFFAPYFGINERADSVFRLAGTYTTYKVSHLYRYNAKSLSNILGLVVNRQQGGDNGYIPYPRTDNYPDTLIKSATVRDIDSTKLRYVQKFIDLCYANGTKVIFTVSPSYSIVDRDYYDVIKEVALHNDIPFMDYHTHGLFLEDAENFRDQIHLRDEESARRFSVIFAHDLKQVLERWNN